MQVADNTIHNKTQGITNPVSQRLLSLKQASKYLGRGEDSMRELIYARVFPVVQMGKKSKMWLDINDLDQWVEDNKRYA